jgi:hypothetical protein
MRLTRALHPNPFEANGMPPTYETMHYCTVLLRPVLQMSQSVYARGPINAPGSWFLPKDSPPESA